MLTLVRGRSVQIVRFAVAIPFLLSLRFAGAQGVAGNPAYSAARGPIPIRDARPYNLLFLQFVPESGDVLPPGKNRFDAQLDVINNLLVPAPNGGSVVVEDNEYQRIRLGWRRGVGRQLEVSLFVPIEWRNGGFLDPIIRAYHHLVGLLDNSDDVPLGRDHYPEYRSILEIMNSNGHVLVNQGNAFGLGETQATIKRSLVKATRRGALDARLGLKIPTGNPTLILGSGSFDEGLSFDGRYNVGRNIIFYGNMGEVLMGRASHVPGSRPNTLESLIALEYRPNHRDSFVLQIDGNGQYVRTGNAFADGSNVTATFGFERVLDRHLVGFASFSEGGHIHNYTLPAFSNVSPSFTVSLGITWFQ